MTAPEPSQQQVTQLLVDWSSGDKAALDKLIPLVEPELHRLAHYYMSRESAGHTLQTTALVNEAYLRFVDATHPQWQNRPHFFAVAAQLMRRILINHARAHRGAKRGGKLEKVYLDETRELWKQRPPDLLALDQALKSFAADYPRESEVVELKFFGGLEAKEIAEVLKVSSKTVLRDWSFAKLWLCRELSSAF